jgi:hypothetical protein
VIGQDIELPPLEIVRGPTTMVEMAGDSNCGKLFSPKVISPVPMLNSKLNHLLDVFYGTYSTKGRMITSAYVKLAKRRLLCKQEADKRIQSAAENDALSDENRQLIKDRVKVTQDRCYSRIQLRMTMLGQGFEMNYQECRQKTTEQIMWMARQSRLIRRMQLHDRRNRGTQCRQLQYQLQYKFAREALKELLDTREGQCAAYSTWGEFVKSELFSSSTADPEIASFEAEVLQRHLARKKEMQYRLVRLRQILKIHHRLESKVLDRCTRELIYLRDNKQKKSIKNMDWSTELEKLKNEQAKVALWKTISAEFLDLVHQNVDQFESIQEDQLTASKNCQFIRFPQVLGSDFHVVNRLSEYILRPFDDAINFDMSLIQYMAENSLIRYQSHQKLLMNMRIWIKPFLLQRVSANDISLSDAKRRLNHFRRIYIAASSSVEKSELRRRHFLRSRCKLRFDRHGKQLTQRIQAYVKVMESLIKNYNQLSGEGKVIEAQGVVAKFLRVKDQHAISMRILMRLLNRRSQVCERLLAVTGKQAMGKNILQIRRAREEQDMEILLRTAGTLFGSMITEQEDRVIRASQNLFAVIENLGSSLSAEKAASDSNVDFIKEDKMRGEFQASTVSVDPNLNNALSLWLTQTSVSQRLQKENCAIYHAAVDAARTNFNALRDLARRFMCPGVDCGVVTGLRDPTWPQLCNSIPGLAELAINVLAEATKFSFNPDINTIQKENVLSSLAYQQAIKALDEQYAARKEQILKNPNDLSDSEIEKQLDALQNEIDTSKEREMALWQARQEEIRRQLQDYIDGQLQSAKILDATLNNRLEALKTALETASSSEAPRIQEQIDQTKLQIKNNLDLIAKLQEVPNSILDSMNTPMTEDEALEELQKLEDQKKQALINTDKNLFDKIKPIIEDAILQESSALLKMKEKLEELQKLNDPSMDAAIKAVKAAIEEEQSRVDEAIKTIQLQANQLRQDLSVQLQSISQDADLNAHAWIQQKASLMQVMVNALQQAAGFNVPSVALFFNEYTPSPPIEVIPLDPVTSTLCVLQTSQETCSLTRVCPNGACCNNGRCAVDTNAADCGAGTYCSARSANLILRIFLL